MNTTDSKTAVRGKVVVITGASSGIGLETAKRLAAEGAEIVMVARDQAGGEQARTQIARVATGKPPVLLIADLSVQAQIRRLAGEIEARYQQIDILINNAGNAFTSRQLSADGFELTWAINALAPFLLTQLLLPLLTAAPAGRVVNLTTEVYSHKLHLDNLQGEHTYSWMGAYRTSKLGVVLFTTELARRLAGTDVTAITISPGPTKTNFGGGGPSGAMGAMFKVLKHTPLLKQPEQAAETIAWAATTPELDATPGAFYLQHKQQKLKGDANDPTLAAKLWTISEQQTRIDPAQTFAAVAPAA
jgi:NAD(P)-dependent dehydrogenase (short-subunit alcohol dehydrogenase family)